MNHFPVIRWFPIAFALLSFTAAPAFASDPDIVMTDSTLEKELQGAVAGFHGSVGIYFRNLSSATEAAVNADETFPTASLVKVPILAVLLARVDRGELDYNRELVMTSTRSYDADDLAANLKDGARISPAKLVWLMESLSDNTAALWCQDLAGGGAAINTWLGANGFSRTRVNSRTEGREADKTKYGWGQTTAQEMADLMLLASPSSLPDIVKPAVSQEMLRVLSKSYWDGEALSQIPPWVHVASKQGAVDHSRSEVLLVDAPSGRYVLSVLTKDQADIRYEHDNEGYELIRRVSRTVWEHEAGAAWKTRPESLRFYKKD